MADPEAPGARDGDEDEQQRFMTQVLLALDGELGPEAQAELKSELASDVDRRRWFVELCLQSRTLSEVLSLNARGVAADDQAVRDARELTVVGVQEDEDSCTAPRRGAGGRWAAAAASLDRRQHRLGLALALAGAAAAIIVGLTLTLLLAPGWPRDKAPIAARPYPRVDVASGLALVVKLDGVQWELGEEPHPSEGDLLAPGRLRFRAGRATLSMLNGVVLTVEGPADLDLIAIDRVFCRRGRLRTRVPAEASGFVVSAPDSSILDLGTEFGLNVEASGKARVTVFEGQAEALIHSGAGDQNLSQFVAGGKEFEIDPKAGRIEPVAGASGFIAPQDPREPSLVLDASYPATIRAARPWSYWRFESLDDGKVANEVPGQPPLLVHGPIELTGIPSKNRAAQFRDGVSGRYFVLDGPWQPTLPAGYAVELWFLPRAIDHAALVTMVAPNDTNNHFLILEMSSRNRHALHPPGSVRFLDRWPPAMGGGCNIYSKRPYVPDRWHHLVAQVKEGRMELFLDGEPTYSSRVDIDHPTTSCQFLLGRLSTVPIDDWLHNRAFVGRLDEVALYNHPLAIEEIRLHRELVIHPQAGPGVARRSELRAK